MRLPRPLDLQLASSSVSRLDSHAMTDTTSTASTSSAGEGSSGSSSTLKEKLHHIGEKVRLRAEKRASTGEVASGELTDA